MTTRLTIVIPCYNEAKNIPLILNRFQEVTTRGDIKLLLIDNGSKDDSAEVLARELPNSPSPNPYWCRSIKVTVTEFYRVWLPVRLTTWLDTCRYADRPQGHSASDGGDRKVQLPNEIYVKGQRRGRPLSDSFFTGGMSIFESSILAHPCGTSTLSRTFFIVLL